jgi:predicted MFS family arabinose efflux permease
MFTLTHRIGRAARLISLSYFLWGVGEGLWYYIQPLYPERLGANPQQIGLVLSMMGIGRLIALLPVTLAMERYNPRLTMIPGYLCGPLSMLIMVLAPTWEWTMPAFLIYGASAAALVPVTVYLSHASTRDTTRDVTIELHTILSYSWAAHMAGIIISPTIGGFVGDWVGLRGVFAISGVWFTLSALTAIATPTFHAEMQGRTFGRETLVLLEDRAFMQRNLLFVLIFAAGPIGYAMIPKFLDEIHNYSTNALGIFGMISAVGSTICSLYLGRFKPWNGLLVGQVVLFAAFGLIFINQFSPVVGISYLFYGVWLALRPLATTLLARIVTETQQGFAFALIDLFYGVTGILAPFIAGMLYAEETSLPLLIAMALVAITLGMTFYLRNAEGSFALYTTRE